jgi:hypothetical protein
MFHGCPMLQQKHGSNRNTIQYNYQYTYRAYCMLLKILPSALYASLLSVQVLHSRSCLSYVSYATTAVVVSLTSAEFKALIPVLSLSGFALSSAANIVDFLWLLIISYTILFYNHIRREQSRAQFADRCSPWEISNGAENLVLQALQL